MLLLCALFKGDSYKVHSSGAFFREIFRSETESSSRRQRIKPTVRLLVERIGTRSGPRKLDSPISGICPWVSGGQLTGSACS